MSLLTEVISLLPLVAFNKGRVRHLVSELLEDVLAETRTLQNELPVDDDRTELEDRITKVAKVVDLLHKNASTVSVLRAAAEMADGQDPTLVVATRDNLPTKKAYFLNLDARVCNFIDSLNTELNINLSPKARQIVSDKTTAASAQIVMHEVLFRAEDEPEAVHDISEVNTLIERLQKDPSDNRALTELRTLFESDHHFAAFQADGELIEIDRARELLNPEHDDCLHQATVFRVCSETEFTSIPLVHNDDKVEQPILSLTAITNKQSFLSYCPADIRFKLKENLEAVLAENEKARAVSKTALRQLQMELVEELTNTLSALEAAKLSCEERHREAAALADKDADWLSHLQRGNLAFVLGKFTTREALHGFCHSLELPETQTALVLADWDRTREWFFTRTPGYLFTRAKTGKWYKADCRLLASKFQVREKASRAVTATAADELRIITTAIDETKKIKLECEKSMDEIKKILNAFCEIKDKPIFWRKERYARFIAKKKALIELHRQVIEYETRDPNENIKKPDKCFFQEAVALHKLAGNGFCLFGGGFRTKKKKLKRTLSQVPSAAAAA